MNSIWNNFFLLILVLLAAYSHGRSVSEWSTTNDLSLIDECLRKSVNRINKLQNTKAKSSDASNIACITQFNNGIHIILTFQLEEQGWKCSLYKSLVQILPVQYEKCDQIDTAALRQPESKNKNNGEDSDEAKIDKIHQSAQEKAEDHKQDNADMKDGNDHGKHSGNIEKNNGKEAHNNNEDDDEPKPNLKKQQNEHDDEEDNKEDGNDNDGDEKEGDNEKDEKKGDKEKDDNDEYDKEEDDEPKSNSKNQQKGNIDEEEDDEPKSNSKNQQKGNIDEEEDSDELGNNEQALQELGRNDPEVEA